MSAIFVAVPGSRRQIGCTESIRSGLPDVSHQSARQSIHQALSHDKVIHMKQKIATASNSKQVAYLRGNRRGVSHLQHHDR